MSARNVLIEAALRRAFRTEDEYQEYMQIHTGRKDPFMACPDFTCQHARTQADDALAALKAAGFRVEADS